MRIKFFWGDVTVPSEFSFQDTYNHTTSGFYLGLFSKHPRPSRFHQLAFCGVVAVYPPRLGLSHFRVYPGLIPAGGDIYPGMRKLLREELTEHQLKIEGQYLSKHDMKEKLNLSEPPESINVTHTSSGADIGFDFES